MSLTPCVEMQTTCFSCGGPLCYVPPRVCEPSYCYGCQALMEAAKVIPADPGWIPTDPDRILEQWPKRGEE